MLFVEDVRCTACVWLIERALQSLPGVASVRNALARRARITWIDERVSSRRSSSGLRERGRAWPLHARALDDFADRKHATH